MPEPADLQLVSPSKMEKQSRALAQHLIDLSLGREKKERVDDIHFTPAVLLPKPTSNTNTLNSEIIENEN